MIGFNYYFVQWRRNLHLWSHMPCDYKLDIHLLKYFKSIHHRDTAHLILWSPQAYSLLLTLPPTPSFTSWSSISISRWTFIFDSTKKSIILCLATSRHPFLNVLPSFLSKLWKYIFKNSLSLGIILVSVANIIKCSFCYTY